MKFCFICLRNEITLNIGFSSFFSSVVHISAAILEILVKISEIFFQHFLAHIYSGKVTKAFVTILSGFRATGQKVRLGGKIPPPNCNIRVKFYS